MLAPQERYVLAPQELMGNALLAGAIVRAGGAIGAGIGDCVAALNSSPAPRANPKRSPGSTHRSSSP